MNQDLIDYELSYLGRLDVILSMSITGLTMAGEGECCKLHEEVKEMRESLRILHHKVVCRYNNLHFISAKEVD